MKTSHLFTLGLLVATFSLSALAQMTPPPLARQAQRESRQRTIDILERQAAREKLYRKEKKKHKINSSHLDDHTEFRSARFRQALIQSKAVFTSIDGAQNFCRSKEGRLATETEMKNFVLLQCMFTHVRPARFTSEEECRERIKTYDIWSQSSTGNDLLRITIDGSAKATEFSWSGYYTELMQRYDADPSYAGLSRNPEHFGKVANCIRELNEHDIYYINRNL